MLPTQLPPSTSFAAVSTPLPLALHPVWRPCISCSINTAHLQGGSLIQIFLSC